MVKEVKIGEKNYEMLANAHMLLKYREIFGESCVKKLDEISKATIKSLEVTEDMFLYGSRLAYVMTSEIKGYNQSYDEFMKDFDFGEDANWLMEVIGLAQSVFPRKAEPRDHKEAKQ